MQRTAGPTEATTSAIDGVKGFIGKAFETIKGLFGGGNRGGDSPTTTKKSTTSKGGSSTTKVRFRRPVTLLSSR